MIDVRLESERIVHAQGDQLLISVKLGHFDQLNEVWIFENVFRGAILITDRESVDVKAGLEKLCGFLRNSANEIEDRIGDTVERDKSFSRDRQKIIANTQASRDTQSIRKTITSD